MKLLTAYEFPGDEIPIIKGSALKALRRLRRPDCALTQASIELMDAVDSYIPEPVRDMDKPFLMPIEDVFTISGRGTVVTGRVERGIIKAGEEVEIIGLGDPEDRCHLRRDVPEDPGPGSGRRQRRCPPPWHEEDDVERGQVLAKPGSITPHTKFKGEVYILTKEEGGRHTPFFAGYRPQFYLRTTDVTGVAELKLLLRGDTRKPTYVQGHLTLNEVAKVPGSLAGTTEAGIDAEGIERLSILRAGEDSCAGVGVAELAVVQCFGDEPRQSARPTEEDCLAAHPNAQFLSLNEADGPRFDAQYWFGVNHLNSPRQKVQRDSRPVHRRRAGGNEFAESATILIRPLSPTHRIAIAPVPCFLTRSSSRSSFRSSRRRISLPGKWRWSLLLFASCWFYMAFVPPTFSFWPPRSSSITSPASRSKGRPTAPQAVPGDESRRQRRHFGDFKFYPFIAENLEFLFARMGHPYTLPPLDDFYTGASRGISAVLSPFGIQWESPPVHLLLPIGLSFHTFRR